MERTKLVRTELDLLDYSSTSYEQKKKGKKSTQSIVVGSKTFSIQAEDYRPLPNDSYEQLDDFLSSLNLNRNTISAIALFRLFQQEMSYFSWLKWCWLDSLAERSLQGLLLRPGDLVKAEVKESCYARVKPTERSLPLKKSHGLRKAYFARGLVKGTETGIFTSIHMFIYSMLLYRFVKLVQTGDAGFDEFYTIFSGSNEKGIDSLVQLLAQVKAGWLKLILTTPFILGALQGLWSLRRASLLTTEELMLIQAEASHYLMQPSSIGQDILRESIPIMLSLISLSAKIQKLEQYVRWDGRLSLEDREKSFTVIREVAIKGRKVAQLTALQSLAKIAQGLGLRDIARLQEIGCSTEELQLMLKIKATALEDLMMVVGQNHHSTSADSSAFIRFYAVYLLWWLGQSTSTIRQRLPFALIKAIKLVLELYFLNEIITSILEAIRCPDKQGFELGFGYPEWATELTTDCFIQLIENQFRTFNLSDPVDDLIAQIPLFNLVDLNSLILYYKNLTGIEMVQILTTIDTTGATLTELEIDDYFADDDMAALANYLETSTIQNIRLGCENFTYPGGEGLTNQGLQSLTNILPMTQITYLRICFPNVNNTGIITLANTLNTTKIDEFYLVNANISDEGGKALAYALATMPIRKILLSGSQIGDGTIQTLVAVIQNNPLLTYLGVQGNFITDQGAEYLAQIVKYSSLNTLALISKNITDAGVMALTASLQQMSSLNYGLAIGSQCGEAGILSLAQQLNQTTISVLELWNNAFTIESMKALAIVFPYTNIIKVSFVGQQFTGDIIAELANGIRFSLITTLSFTFSKLSNAMALLAPGIIKLEAIQFSSCQLTDDDFSSLIHYLPGSSIQKLYLPSNNISDGDVLALVAILPNTNIISLNLANNNITNIGVQALANIYSSTRLQKLYLYGNPASADLLAQIESFQWQVYCKDRLCYSNTEYNDYTTTLAPYNKSLVRYSNHHKRRHRVIHTREPMDLLVQADGEVIADISLSQTSSASRVQPLLGFHLFLQAWSDYFLPLSAFLLSPLLRLNVPMGTTAPYSSEKFYYYEIQTSNSRNFVQAIEDEILDEDEDVVGRDLSLDMEARSSSSFGDLPSQFTDSVYWPTASNGRLDQGVSFSSALLLGSPGAVVPTQTPLTSEAAAGIIVGTVTLGIIFYKNCTLLHDIAYRSYQLWQWCRDFYSSRKARDQVAKNPQSLFIDSLHQHQGLLLRSKKSAAICLIRMHI